MRFEILPRWVQRSFSAKIRVAPSGSKRPLWLVFRVAGAEGWRKVLPACRAPEWSQLRGEVQA